MLKWYERRDIPETLVVYWKLGEIRIKLQEEDAKIPQSGSLRNHAMISKKNKEQKGFEMLCLWPALFENFF